MKRRNLQLTSGRRLLVRPKTNGEVPGIVEASLDTNSKDVSDQAVPPAKEEPQDFEGWVWQTHVQNVDLGSLELTV